MDLRLSDKTALAADNAISGGGPAAEFAAFIAQEQKIWSDIVRRARIKPD